jgi:hypothetical protein
MALPFKSFGRAHASTPLRHGRAIRYNLLKNGRIFTAIPHAKEQYKK